MQDHSSQCQRDTSHDSLHDMVAACRADSLWYPSGAPGPFHTSCRSPVRFGHGFDTRRVHDLLRNSRHTCQQKQRSHVPKEHGTRPRDAVSVFRGRLLDVLDEKHQDAAGYPVVGPEREDRPSCRSRPHLQQPTTFAPATVPERWRRRFWNFARDKPTRSNSPRAHSSQ